MSKQNELAQLADAVTVSGSNVGIGTSSPDKKFVVSEGGAHGFEISPYDGNQNSTRLINYNRNTNAYFPLEIEASQIAFETNGTERMRIDSSGRVTKPNQPSFSVSKTGGAVGAGTFVVWNHVEHNVGSHYNTSNGIFTAPVSGVYAVSLNVMDESTSTHLNKQLNIYRNSYNYQRVYGTNGVASSHGRWTWSGNIYMSANDTLKILVNDMTIYGNQRDYSNFSGFLVG